MRAIYPDSPSRRGQMNWRKSMPGWAAAKSQGFSQPIGPRPYIVVLNHEGGVNFNPDWPIERNGRDGNPLRLAGEAYSRGLFAHSATRPAVRLPSPAKTSRATVGVEDHTSGCAYRRTISASKVGNYTAGKRACRYLRILEKSASSRSMRATPILRNAATPYGQRHR